VLMSSRNPQQKAKTTLCQFSSYKVDDGAHFQFYMHVSEEHVGAILMFIEHLPANHGEVSHSPCLDGAHAFLWTETFLKTRGSIRWLLVGIEASESK
jgi:hypothetical protein